jgi:hypothetical protein
VSPPFAPKKVWSLAPFIGGVANLAVRDGQAVSFVPVQVIDKPAPVGIELALAGGRRLLVRQNFDPQTLRQIVRVLEDPACRTCRPLALRHAQTVPRKVKAASLCLVLSA